MDAERMEMLRPLPFFYTNNNKQNKSGVLACDVKKEKYFSSHLD